MRINFWSSILFFAALLGYFLGILLLFHKRGNKVSNRILSILQIIIALLITEYLCYSTGIYHSFGIAVSVMPLAFLIGPLYYFYSRSLLQSKFKFRANLFFHFIPFILCLINFIDYYAGVVSYFNGNKEATFDPIIPINGYIYMGAEILQATVYVITVYMMFKTYKNNLPQNVNGIESIKIKWLQRLTNIFLVYLFLKLVSFMFLLLIQYYLQVEYVLALGLGVILYVIGYSAVNIPEIFSGIFRNGLAQKYQHSSLTELQIEEYLNKLSNYINQERPYLNPDLKLINLAEALSIPTSHLSQLFSQELKTNFFDYINSYRIEAAKQLFSDPGYKDSTILAIAFDSGFNSKTSFNRIFKKYTGITPSEYLRSIP